LTFIFVGSAAHAFELLSDGAMDSVSAFPGQSAEEESSAIFAEDGYEALPFETVMKIGASEIEEVSTELNFALTQEVENWANLVQPGQDVQIEVGTVDILPPSSFDVPEIYFGDGYSDIEEFELANGAKAQRGRVTSEFHHYGKTTDHAIGHVIEGYVERAASIGFDPHGDGAVIGNTYLSDIHTFSRSYTQEQ